MANLLVRTGKTAPSLLATSMFAKSPFEVLSQASKSFSYVGSPAVVQGKSPFNGFKHSFNERNRMLYKSEILHVTPFVVTEFRMCTSNVPNQAPSSPNRSPGPTQAQVERVFFRTVAFFWDLGKIFFDWSRHIFKTHVIDDPKVKFYWQVFLEKMEQSKKNV